MVSSMATRQSDSRSGCHRVKGVHPLPSCFSKCQGFVVLLGQRDWPGCAVYFQPNYHQYCIKALPLHQGVPAISPQGLLSLLTDCFHTSEEILYQNGARIPALKHWWKNFLKLSSKHRRTDSLENPSLIYMLSFARTPHSLVSLSLPFSAPGHTRHP